MSKKSLSPYWKYTLLGGILASALFVVSGCSSTAQSQSALTSAPSDESAELGTEELVGQDLRSRVPERDLKPVNTSARAAVGSAYRAMQNRQWDLLPGFAYGARDDHEIGAYPTYWFLRNHINTVSSTAAFDSAALKKFIEDNPNSYMAERLKAEWLIKAAALGDYRSAAALGAVNINLPQAQCALIQSQAATGQRVGIRDALTSFSPGNSCWAMLQTLNSQGRLSFEHLQSGLRDAVEYDNKNSARRYAALVFSPAQLAQYDAIINDPRAWISRQSGAATSPLDAELRAIAFSRLARQDREQGIQILRGTNLLSEKDKQWAYAQFGLVSVLNLEDRSDSWYQQSKDIALSDYNAAWRVRAALRQPTINWQRVKDTIEMMSKEQQKETAWVYWHSRALAALGQTSAAQNGYRSLLDHYDFYGQLAREALDQKITWPEQATPVTAAELNQIKRNSGLQNAVALLGIGAREYAVVEWNHAIRGLSDRQLMAAAEWANQVGFYDRTINTSLLTKQSVNFKQRFVAPFDGRVTAQARRVGVSPAWVYGLIRQESRFVPVARSGVGASGLMQLMPGTAQLVARKLGVQNYNQSMINDFDTNTLFGTTYLKDILDKQDGSEVLATVGYNAGPNRAVRWRNSLSEPVEGAIFTETIPFTETRLYVKHVLSNAVWYDIKFNNGRPTSLAQRLGTIRP
ncbi:MAG: transglycosylase SLT domain-containing protein [Alcaligenaceae bacterium]|nr:transglycosylase SLT domain-containing protein [Alcaligenaceae bacterium]